MPKLIVNPSTPQAWEIPLSDGVITLGRDESNTYPIQHDSISGTHCQVERRENLVTLRDLGSTNGSFVEGQPVSEVVLRDGQLIRLGDVEFRFQADAPVAAVNIPAPPPSTFTPRISLNKTAHASSPLVEPVAANASGLPPVPGGPMNCKFHPKVPAGYYCGKCQKAYCSLCVNQRAGATYCRACAQPCTPLDLSYLAEVPEEVPFYKQIPGAFAYPFKGSGVWMMAIGSVLFAAIAFASQFSRYVWVILVGYSALYAQTIIHATSQGDHRGPAWPETSANFIGEVRTACWQVVVTCLLCFAPALGLLFWSASEGGEASWLVITAAILGCLYLPMALLAVAMFDSIAAMNPTVVFPAIAKIPAAYALTSFALVLLVALKAGIYLLFSTLIPVPFVPDLLTSLFGFYLLTVSTYLMGLMYYTQRYQIGWFNH